MKTKYFSGSIILICLTLIFIQKAYSQFTYEFLDYFIGPNDKFGTVNNSKKIIKKCKIQYERKTYNLEPEKHSVIQYDTSGNIVFYQRPNWYYDSLRLTYDSFGLVSSSRYYSREENKLTKYEYHGNNEHVFGSIGRNYKNDSLQSIAFSEYKRISDFGGIDLCRKSDNFLTKTKIIYLSDFTGDGSTYNHKYRFSNFSGELHLNQYEKRYTFFIIFSEPPANLHNTYNWWSQCNDEFLLKKFRSSLEKIDYIYAKSNKLLYQTYKYNYKSVKESYKLVYYYNIDSSIDKIEVLDKNGINMGEIKYTYSYF